jgi:hypothetical protein
MLVETKEDIEMGEREPVPAPLPTDSSGVLRKRNDYSHLESIFSENDSC